MNTDDKNDNAINEILKETHNEIEPSDSWQALRARIDDRIDTKQSVSVSTVGNVFFWRRLAFGMAACFLVTAGILLYFLGAHYSMQEYHQQQVATVNNLLDQADLNRLSFAFSQVRQLFGQQSQWIMVGSGDSTQMGVADKMGSGVDNRKIIVVRLAVNLDDVGSPRQYFDVVTFSNQQTDFQLPIAGASAINISLTPILKDNGRIEVEIDAHADARSRTNTTSAIFDDRFTSLVRMRANGNWINIDGIGQSVSEI
ncbi:MAG: hypothetical protein ACYTE8_01410 [Planctomycetota bacterium]|jgi:hypothetical protein